MMRIKPAINPASVFSAALALIVAAPNNKKINPNTKYAREFSFKSTPFHNKSSSRLKFIWESHVVYFDVLCRVFQFQILPLTENP